MCVDSASPQPGILPVSSSPAFWVRSASVVVVGGGGGGGGGGGHSSSKLN